jgi:hypothetical protein
MGFGETLVAIVMIIAIAISSTVRSGQKAHRRDATPGDLPRIEDAEFRALKERVAVLERLATDDTRRLDHEIERLRDRDLA